MSAGWVDDWYAQFPAAALQAISETAVVDLLAAHADWVASLSGAARLLAKLKWAEAMGFFEADAAAVDAVVELLVSDADRRRGARR